MLRAAFSGQALVGETRDALRVGFPCSARPDVCFAPETPRYLWHFPVNATASRETTKQPDATSTLTS